jgi:methionine--tRNA ligase beta chain
LQLTVGRIVEVAHHQNASKLFVETVDFGTEVRTIVSGLVGSYREDDLRGKTALFVTNLAAANLRGVQSNGMILAAQGETVEVLFVDAPAGALATLEGAQDAAPGQITIDEFAKHTLEVKDHKVFCDGKPVIVAGKPVMTKVVANGSVR